MNRTKEQVRKAIFGKLKCLRQRLNAQGLPCTYSRSVLSHDNGVNGFTITYKTGGNNGDTTLLPRITIRTIEGTENFDFLNFDQGLARIEELFQASNGGKEASESK